MLGSLVLPWQGSVQQAQMIPAQCSLKFSAYFPLLDKHLQGLALQWIFGFELSDADTGCTHGFFTPPSRTMEQMRPLHRLPYGDNRSVPGWGQLNDAATIFDGFGYNLERGIN